MSKSNEGFSLENLKALEVAIADGTKRVKYTDKEVEFRTLDEMLRIRDLMRKSLGIKSGCGKKGLFGGRRTTAIFSKGLDDC